MVLAVLTIVWLVVIGSYLKEKTSTKTGDTVSAFQDQLSTLQRTQPGGHRVANRSTRPTRSGPGRSPNRLSAPPVSLSSQARTRRRNTLFTLVGLAAITFVAALVTASLPIIVVNIVLDLAAAAFIVLLVNQQRIAQEQRVKVRRLRPAQALPAQHRFPRPTAAAGGRFR